MQLHRDTCKNFGENNYAVYSLVVYLNDDYSGGETRFVKSQKKGLEFESFRGKAGDCLFLRQELLHCGGTVIEGVKYILHADVAYKLQL